MSFSVSVNAGMSATGCCRRKLRAVSESPRRFEVHFLLNEVYHANRVLRNTADMRQTGMFDAPLPDEFDPSKDIPEEIEVHVANCTGDSFKYDLVTEPPPGHTRLRILIPDGFQIITVSTTAQEVAIEVEDVIDFGPRSTGRQNRLSARWWSRARSGAATSPSLEPERKASWAAFCKPVASNSVLYPLSYKDWCVPQNLSL